MGFVSCTALGLNRVARFFFILLPSISASNYSFTAITHYQFVRPLIHMYSQTKSSDKQFYSFSL